MLCAVVRSSPTWAIVVLGAWIGACFSDGNSVADGGTTGGDEPCPEGSVTCPCYGNGTCDAGLACQPDLLACIPEDCTPGALNCDCDQGACLDPTTECIAGLCQVPPSSTDSGVDGTSGTGSPDSDTSGSDGGTDDGTEGPNEGTTSAACPTEATAPDGSCARFVFVLDSGQWSPDSGPMLAAQVCSDRAMSAGLPGTYLAYLATTGQEAMANAEITAGDGFAYVKPPVASPVLVANDGGAFSINSDGFEAPIDARADGSMVEGNDCASAFVVTGVSATGGAGANCGDWADASSEAEAGNASVSGDSVLWQNGCGTVPCDVPVRIYCVQRAL